MTDPKYTEATVGDVGADEVRAPSRQPIRLIATGVPGLDAVLGGGVPEHSFNVIAGAPGAGKTTLALQLLFANATAERPALYFTMVGEPTIKLLRYQQQFTFFRPERVGAAIHFRNLSAEVLAGDFDAVLARITAEVERLRPSLVVVDSFRSVHARGPVRQAARRATSRRTDAPTDGEPGAMGLETFIQHLALQLTTWEVTSFLLGEYARSDVRHPVFTVADGILWLTQATDRNSVVRKLQVNKVRGQAHMPGLHTFRITDAGVQVFPRIPEQQWDRKVNRTPAPKRLATGVPGLDALMGGGIPAGDAVMIAGPTGSGKTTFSMQFVADGLRRGDACVVAVFEEYPESYLARLATLGVDAEAMTRAGLLTVSYLRPLDLSVDETLAEILAAVERHGATRVVIDSLTGLEIALAPAFRDDFRESLYRLVGALTATNVTVLMTYEVVAPAPDGGFTGARVSFITDDIVVQRFVEIDGVLRKVLSVVKMRRSEHSEAFWTYTITAGGATVGAPLTGYHGIQTGIPDRQPDGSRPAVARRETEGATDDAERGVLDALVRVGDEPSGAAAAQIVAAGHDVVRALARLLALGSVAPRDRSDGDASSAAREPEAAARPAEGQTKPPATRPAKP